LNKLGLKLALDTVMHFYSPNCEIKPGMSLPDGVQRVALVVEYCGTPYQGFQRQSSARRTVQGDLELALSKVAAAPITLVCAGRTDAGVHATQQVVHFDTSASRPLKAWVEGVNTHLPDSIRVHHAQNVPPEFHARFSAQARTYRYVTYSGPVRPALLSDCVTWVSHRLDIVAMQAGANSLLGEHDFTSFRATQCQAQSPIRTIEHLQIMQRGPLIVVELRANAFLHHMVRNIMGSLFVVGRGLQPPEWIGQLLKTRNRALAAATAPPFGLYLVGVNYPPELGFTYPPYGPHFLERE
jgi:tRNA pseudouridine38-40 synthase